MQVCLCYQCLEFMCFNSSSFTFFFNDTATTEIYTLSLHDALPIYQVKFLVSFRNNREIIIAVTLHHWQKFFHLRSEEHTSELQSLRHLVCRLLLEKKNVKLVRLDTSSTENNKT